MTQPPPKKVRGETVGSAHLPTPRRDASEMPVSSESATSHFTVISSPRGNCLHTNFNLSALTQYSCLKTSGSFGILKNFYA